MAYLGWLFFLWPLFMSAIVLSMRGRREVSQWVNMICHIPWVILFFMLLGQFDWVGGQSNIIADVDWFPALKSQFLLALDWLNLPLIALNLFLSFMMSFFTLKKDNYGAGYLSLFSLLNFASIGSLLALDAFTFYLFWEFMLIPLFFLIGFWGSKNRLYAAFKFFVITMGASLLMLAAIVALAWKGDVHSLAWTDLMNHGFTTSGGLFAPASLVFLGFLIAFLVKVPLWPLHTWLPDAHTEAPTGGSVILAGVLLKLGTYGIVRWCLPIFPDAVEQWAPIVMLLSVCGILLGSFGAWKQTDIKRMIAYSSVAHLGFVVLGIFSLQQEALSGALFQNIAHGLATGALFLIFGVIYERTHTRKISDYSGFAEAHPALATMFMIACFASIGLPGLAGFVGEFLILTGTFMGGWVIFAFLGLIGILLGAIYTLSSARQFVFGQKGGAFADKPLNVTWNEWVAIVPFLFLLIYLGLKPGFILRLNENILQSGLF